MSDTFIAGYETTVTLNAGDLSAIGSVVGLNLSKNVMTKPVFGSAAARKLGGQKNGQFSASGHVSAEKVAALNTIYNAASVAASVQIGTAATATDGGVYSGTVICGNLSLTANADGEWDWSMDCEFDGTVTYTPADESSSSGS